MIRIVPPPPIEGTLTAIDDRSITITHNRRAGASSAPPRTIPIGPGRTRVFVRLFGSMSAQPDTLAGLAQGQFVAAYVTGGVAESIVILLRPVAGKVVHCDERTLIISPATGAVPNQSFALDSAQTKVVLGAVAGTFKTPSGKTAYAVEYRIAGKISDLRANASVLVTARNGTAIEIRVAPLLTKPTY